MTGARPVTAEELELLVHGNHGQPALDPRPAPPRRRRRDRPGVQAARQVRHGRLRRPGLPAPRASRASSSATSTPASGSVTCPSPKCPATASRWTTATGAITVDDPYRYLPTLGEMDLHLINEGRHELLWTVLGAHLHRYDGAGSDPIEGTSFAVWAPSAKGVRIKGDFNCWDGREHPMRAVLGHVGAVRARRRERDEVQVPDPRRRRRVAREGRPDGLPHRDAPATSSVVFESSYAWGDDAWMDTVATNRPCTGHVGLRDAPRVVEEALGRRRLHLPAGRRRPSPLPDRSRFTHVEFLPVMEHPYGGSWGYQVTSYFAPTARFGDPDGFRYLVDSSTRPASA